MQDPRNQQELRKSIRSAQIKALYGAPPIMLANPINASLLAVIVWADYPPRIILIWLSLFWIVTGLRMVDRVRYWRRPDAADDSTHWAHRFTWGAGATGLLWGLSGSIVFTSPNPLTHVLVTFVLGGMTVGAIFQEAAYLPAFFCYAVPAVIPQVVLYLAEGAPASIVMGLMLAAYTVVVAAMGRYLNRWIVEAIRLRLDQTAMNSELQAAVGRGKEMIAQIEQFYQYSPVGLYLMDDRERFVRVNEHLAEINGVPAKAHVGRSLRDIVPELAERISELHRPVYERGEPVLNAEIHGAAPSSPGMERYWLANFFPFLSETGKVTGLMGAVLDITELKRTQSALQQSEERFHTIFESVNDIIFLVDFQTGAYVEVNRPACETFGYSRDEMLQLKVGDLSPNEPPFTGDNLLSRVCEVRSGPPQTFDWRAVTKQGRRLWVEVSLRRATFGGRDFLLATGRDISQRKDAENRLQRMAQYDLLTGLANRRVFVAELDRALQHARRGGPGFAVLYLDLDHFKDVNDTLGHPIGDRLLQALAKRLRTNVRNTDTAARFGGDEFALLMAGVDEPADAGLLAAKLLRMIDKPFTIDGNRIQSGLSIGIATYQPDVKDAETLLAHADLALYRAKSEGRHTYRFFTAAMDAEVQKRVTLTSELRAAIEADQLFMVYQPQADMESGALVGLEALIRWNHPDRGLLLPGDFLPAAERSGLIVMLGAWALRAVCRQARQWLDAGLTPPPLAVNVSALQFRAIQEFETLLDETLSESSLPAGALEIEITETALMGIWNGNDNAVQRLRARGLRIAIDDFGTGYSSLLYLRRFPVDRIKIAQEFVKDIGREANDTAIVKAAISLARELGIGVIAEGVETAEQVQLLYEWGCRQAQGFYFARPIHAQDALPLVRNGNVARWLAAMTTSPQGSPQPGESHRRLPRKSVG